MSITVPSTPQTFSLKGIKILIVEDNEINQLLARTILQEWGCHVEIANNGEESINTLQRNSYDIILMDMQMPIMGGVQATKIIREEMKLELPIIALTANASKEDERNCMDAGMNDYISKPFREEELYQKISRWLSFDQPKATPQRPVIAKVDETVSDQPLFSVEKLSALSKGNVEFINKMILLFIETAPTQAEKLKKALQDNDLTTIKTISHTMKPSLDMLGVNSLHDTIRDIEECAAKQKNLDTLESQINKVHAVLGQVVEALKAKLKNG